MNISRRFFLIPVLIAFIPVLPSSARAEFLGAIGGIEGVEGSTVPPILGMSGETGLKEGEGVVMLEYDYSRGVYLFGKKIEDPSKEFQIPTSDPNRGTERTERVFRLAYGVTSRLNIGTSVPFVEQRSRFPLTPTGPAEELDSHGIGNVSFAGKYQFSSQPNLAIRLSWTLPGGYAVGDDFQRVGTDLAYSTILAGTSFHVQGGYQWTGRDRQDRERLDTAVANLAVARTFGERFSADLELNYQYLTGTDGLKGVVYVNPPGQKALDLIPGFVVQIKDHLTFAATVDFALDTTLAFGYDTSYSFKLAYKF
ncbi:MAG: hypothetical protein HY283_02605 [Nitrospirae bacterium]|nr:hypothetical protein [Nitrospirota bacterium]